MSMPQDVFLFWEGRHSLHEGHLAAINSVLHHHPHAHVAIYSNSLNASATAAPYRALGLDVDVVRYNCTALSIGYAGASLGRLLQAAIDGATKGSYTSVT